MEVTLPLVSGVDAIDEEAVEQPGDSIQEPIEGETLNGNRQNLVIAIIIGLLIIALISFGYAQHPQRQSHNQRQWTLFRMKQIRNL